jgi:hypothetical protein
MTSPESRLVGAADWHETVRTEIGKTTLSVIPVFSHALTRSTERQREEAVPAGGLWHRAIRLDPPPVRRELSGYSTPTKVDYGTIGRAFSIQELGRKVVAVGVVLWGPGHLSDRKIPVPQGVREKVSQRLDITTGGQAYINGSSRYTEAGASVSVVSAEDTLANLIDRTPGNVGRIALRVAASVLAAVDATWGTDSTHWEANMNRLYGLHEELGSLTGQPEAPADSWYTALPEPPLLYPGISADT